MKVPGGTITTPTLDKQLVLQEIVAILAIDETVTDLLAGPQYISANASNLNSTNPTIVVCDGGDDVVTEIRRRTIVNIHIRTNKPDINASDALCSAIEDAVTNCLTLPANQTLNGEVSRFVELTSEPLQSEDNPTIRMHSIVITYEVV